MKLSKSILNNFLKKLLKPITRFCIANAISFKDLTDLLKESYLKEADLELKSSSNKSNISRLSVLTGINRKEVKRLLNSKNPKDNDQSLIFKILGKWHHSKLFSKNGIPKKLTYGKIDSEFSKLVETVNKDFNPATILFQLQRLNLVKSDNNLLEILTPEFIPTENIDLQFSILADDTDDLISAVTENILSQKEIPNLHRRTMYDNVDPEKLDEIKRWIMIEGLEFHKRAREFISQYDLDINPKENFNQKGTKVVVGTFSNVVLKNED